MIDTDKGIAWIIDTLRKDQSPDGSWAYTLDTGISTDACMIILLRTLAFDDEKLIKGLFHTASTPDLSDLKRVRGDEDPWIRSSEWRSLCAFIQDGVKRLLGIPRELHQLAIERAQKYMLDHLEQDGTFYSYYSSTFLMTFALLSLGYKKTDPVIVKAVEGLRAMKCEINSLPHMQYTTANVWNTSLIGYSLQAAGVSREDPMVVDKKLFTITPNIG